MVYRKTVSLEQIMPGTYGELAGAVREDTGVELKFEEVGSEIEITASDEEITPDQFTAAVRQVLDGDEIM